MNTEELIKYLEKEIEKQEGSYLFSYGIGKASVSGLEYARGYVDALRKVKTELSIAGRRRPTFPEFE